MAPIAPQRCNSKPSSSAHLVYIRFPSTFSFAFNVPGLAAFPAWILPLFAFDAPVATSSLISRTITLRSYFDKARATPHPETPAPIITTSTSSIVPISLPDFTIFE